jgi:hypothetical protein
MKRFVFVLLMLCSVAFAAPKAEKIGPFAEGPEQLRSALAAEGYRIFLPNTLACCDVWLAKQVSTRAQPNDAAGASYPDLHESDFLGVIVFPKGGGGDFRGQPIRPGAYTMRYELLPSDGNHMGVAPYPDMVLLIPVADDPDPSATYDFGKLTVLSLKASRTAHPAAFEMMPATATDQPTVTQTDDGWVVFQAPVTASGGRVIRIALVVKGSGEQ